jgi:hypothetical protein
MRTLQQLAAEAAITDTSTVQISEFQPTLWEAEVQKAGEDFRILQQIVNVLNVGTTDKVVRIPITTSHLSVTTSHTEGDARTYTEMTNLDTVDITPTWKLGAIVISKEIISTSRVDLIQLARYMIAQDMEQDVEAAIIAAMDAGHTTNAVFGGTGNAAVGDLATGDVIAQKDIANAIGAVETDGFSCNNAWLMVHPAQKQALLKDVNLTYAEHYGGRDIILNGEFANVLGVKVLSTTNMTASYGGSWGAAGHQCYLIGKLANGKSGTTLVMKNRPALDYEYLKKYANHYVYYDAEYAAGVVQEKSACIVAVTDA